MIINTFLKDVSSISNHHHVKTDLFKFICVREMTIVAFVSTYATIKLGNKIKRKFINQSMTYAYTNTYWYYIIHSLYPKERKINWEREREREREKLTILTRKVANVKMMSSTSSKKTLVIISWNINYHVKYFPHLRKLQFSLKKLNRHVFCVWI